MALTLADKKIKLQSKGVRIDAELEENLKSGYCTAVSDYMSFMMQGIPVGMLNGFYTDYSPFEVKELEEDKFAVFENGELFSEIEFLPRPKFFDRKTKNGIAMSELLKLVAPGFAIIYMSRECIFVGKSQCKFCVVDKIGTSPHKDPADVAEAVYEGVKEKAIKSHIALTCGALSKDASYEILQNTIKETLSLAKIAISVNPEPPKKLEALEKVSEADSIYINLEVFDRKKRSEILPGKSKIKIEHYKKVFEECTRIFEKNQVCSVLLAGLESDESFLEGVEFLASNSVMPVVVPFYPAFHSKLEHVSPPPAERMKKIYGSSIDIIKRYGLNPFATKGGFMKGGAIFALKEVMNGV